jgi:hypothetical protein
MHSGSSCSLFWGGADTYLLLRDFFALPGFAIEVGLFSDFFQTFPYL